VVFVPVSREQIQRRLFPDNSVNVTTLIALDMTGRVVICNFSKFICSANYAEGTENVYVEHANAYLVLRDLPVNVHFLKRLA
jgi:hypothetical protein